MGLAAFALYLRTLAPGLLWGDSAEFQFAAWLGGFAHPTGYPLYLMLGWLWTHLLPWGDPAWRMNLFSAAWGGVAAGLVYLVALRVLRRVRSGLEASAGFSADRLLALAAALVFSATPTFWSQAVVAEVYTLHVAFVAAILLVALAWADEVGRRGLARSLPWGLRVGWPRLYLLAGLIGLSLAHHRTTLLLLPGLAVFLWMVWGSERRNFRADGSMARRLLLAAALAVAPLLLYAYIPLVAPRVPYFAVALGPGQELPLYESTLQGFLAHISGSVFQSALAAPHGPWLAELAQRLAGEVTWPGVALGVIGIAWLAWRDRRTLALTGLIFVGTVGFNTIYGIGDIHVFYVPVYLIWAVWLVAGATALGQAFTGGVRRVLRADTHAARGAATPANEDVIIAVAMSLLLLGLAGWLLIANFVRMDRSADHAASARWDAILAQPIPPNAILVSNDRDEMAPQWYLKYVEGRRPDLDGLFPLIQPGPAWSDVAGVADQALRSGRPVYLIKPMPGLEVKFELAPLGGQAGPAGQLGELVRVRGPATLGNYARSSGAAFGEPLRLGGYDVQPATVSAGQELAVFLHWEVLAALGPDYTTFVHLVNAAGAVVGQSDHRPGGVYYPTSLWRPGDQLRDAHRFVVAADPGTGPYVLEVGVYQLAPDLQHLGTPQRVGQLEEGG